jgi:hypothetical protein
VTCLGLRHSSRAHQAIRWHFVPVTHREGEPLGGAVKAALALVLTFTRHLDDFSHNSTDLTKMVFARHG